jgi:ABC-type multidrug transport system fused ATPase/permease subunit
MLIVSHRLSIVKDCDMIIAMDKGQIVEIGTHNELMAKKGYYRFLYMHGEAEDKPVETTEAEIINV